MLADAALVLGALAGGLAALLLAHRGHLLVRLPDRRYVVVIFRRRLHMVAAWQERPFPRAPKWQCEIQHLATKHAWKWHWRCCRLKPHIDAKEREFEGVWLTHTTITWGTWHVQWGYELPPGRRRKAPPKLAAAS